MRKSKVIHTESCDLRISAHHLPNGELRFSVFPIKIKDQFYRYEANPDRLTTYARTQNLTAEGLADFFGRQQFVLCQPLQISAPGPSTARD